jgi:hypothetical protein
MIYTSILSTIVLALVAELSQDLGSIIRILTSVLLENQI